jgi:hypothetical protein
MTGVKFVHKNGFYAVISGEVGDDGLREMLRRAAVGVSGVKVVSD